MSEPEIIAAERQEQIARPLSRRSTASVRAEEDYDEHGSPTCSPTYALPRAAPRSPDPWEPFDCDRCAETYRGTFCVHGRSLCASCAPFVCQVCACEDADAAARAEEIREEWWR